MSQYRNIIDQKDYCDQSELLISEYDNNTAVEFEGQLQFINKWLTDETHAPLIIVGEAESGKKTLLCEFLKTSKKAHANWLHLCHFSSITPHYSHILYKIMIELRNYFKVEQRVDLNDEKLRRYFKYWLEVASDFIEKEYLGYQKTEIPKVVIIIEGIDQCFDIKGNIVQTQFWLPHQIPKNIKLILTTKNIKQNQINEATILRYHLSFDKKSKIFSRFEEKTRVLSSKSSKFSLYHLQIINKMIKIKPNFQSSGTNVQQVVLEYINTVSTNGFTSQEIKSILYILTLTRKGLKSKWIQKIVSISQQKWGLFLRFFSFFIVQSGSYYIICNKSARIIIKNLVDFTGEKQKTYRQSISHSIRNQAVHLRQLEEIVYQLYLSQSYSQLKEVISRVENFAMLYTPLSKDLLCQSWVKLEQLQQYDPVFEYNKAIEAYKSHYYPKEEDLYKIIFQISMFFKEYAEFQNARTPQFRHPLIKGEMDQLVQIGIYEELKSLAMIGKLKIYKLKPLQKFTNLPKKGDMSQQIKKEKQNNEGKQNSENELTTQRKLTNKNKQKQKKSAIKARESDISVTDQPSRPETSQSKNENNQQGTEPTLNIEELNVSILANQEKFKNFFTNSMKEYLENYFAPLKKCAIKEKQLSFQSEDSDNDEQNTKDKMEKQLKIIDVQKLKEELILKKFREYLQQSYHKTGEEVRFYYYKQWIWLQFPWICQTVKNVYSQMIKQCLPGSIHFMSPLQQFKFVRQVLKIARTAKESKMNIFTEKKIEVLPLKYSPQKIQQLEAFRKSKANDEDSSRISRTKRPNQFDTLKTNINLNTIDEMLSSQRQFEQNFREKYKELSKGLKYQNSTPNLNMFVTEAIEKPSKLFPSLGKSKFGKQTRSNNRQKQNVDTTKDYTMVIRKYNEIKHENDMLIQKITEMKKLSSIQMNKTKEEHDCIIYHIRNIEEKKEILEKNFNQQSLLQKKLGVIIKICDLNKMYGSESQYLSTYLTSLKQMIQLEELRVKEIKQKITELLENGKGEIKELRRRRKQLKTIKEEHEKMYINLGSQSTNPQYKSMPLEEIEEELKEMEKTIKTRSKKEKSKIEHCISSEDYQFLEEKFGLIYDEKENQTKLKQFSDKFEKKKQLYLKNNELKLQIKHEKETLASLQQKIKNLSQANLNEKRLHTSNELIESKKSLNLLRQRSHLLTDALETLSHKQ